jgi:hypothetical protein
MSTVGASNNASDIGLIVQGTLILLSAIVAVLGYYVQGRLKARERVKEMAETKSAAAREVRLKTLRKKIAIFVGPCVQYCLNIQTNFGYLGDWVKERHPDECKRYRDEEDAEGRSTKKLWSGFWNKRYSIVGTYVEQLIKKDPSSELARHYIRIMKVTVQNYAVPLAELINLHGRTFYVSPENMT